jgi:hypothetical protein
MFMIELPLAACGLALAASHAASAKPQAANEFSAWSEIAS